MKRKFAVLALLAALSAPAQPLRVLIVTGEADQPHHFWEKTTACFRDILRKSGRFEVRVVEEARGVNAKALEGYAAVLLNYHGPRFPEETEAAIENFVRAGGGFVALHQAAYGPFFGMEMQGGKWRASSRAQPWAAYAEMIGARWEPSKIGHARRGEFTVEWKDPEHPISRGLPASFVADDELYHRLTLAPGVKVLADAMSPVEMRGTGQREPLVWVKPYGKGRVLFTTLGHDEKAWSRAAMMDLLARGVEWAATGEVSIAPFRAATK